jgi:hypothetical protein
MGQNHGFALEGPDAEIVVGSYKFNPTKRAKSPQLKVRKSVNPCVRMDATYRAS